jgi:hypothetical protein
MSELKDEAICTAHSSVKCNKKLIASYDTPRRGCELNFFSDNPYTSRCNFKMIIKAPVVKEEPLPEISELKPITTMPVTPTSDDLPF